MRRGKKKEHANNNSHYPSDRIRETLHEHYIDETKTQERAIQSKRKAPKQKEPNRVNQDITYTFWNRGVGAN